MHYVYRRRSPMTVFTGWLLGIVLTAVTLIPLPLAAQSPSTLHIGETADGNLRARQPAEWRFYGCAGDRIRVQMTADAFPPVFELTAEDEDATLLEGEQAAADRAIGEELRVIRSNAVELVRVASSLGLDDDMKRRAERFIASGGNDWDGPSAGT